MTFLFDLIKTICLGIIQGITEWLPISSTGHLLIFNSIWPMLPAEFFDVFKVVIQFGSILAVLYLFHHRLNPWDKSKTEKEKIRTYNLWIKVIVGVIPAAVIGLLLNDIIDEYLSQNFVIAVALIAYGIIFIIVEQHPKKPTIKSIYRMDYKTALKIGFFQCLALIPGTSRSGATILGGLLSGCTRTLASEYSFFIAIPTMFGASLLKVVKYLTNTGMFTLSQLILLLVGTVVSYIVSLFAIRALLDYVKTHDFKVFGWYRIILGCFIILFFYIL
ncbi:MAG: undecaprenyl-diphosphate phosphatase [Absicoccus porci]|jgi:undecaprenyl-diphosphatase|uniref:Undecaprenyl-diphosphatase n=1 Tax=Absicoccus porci TaxID=2486576 RepID=A0A3N0I4K8_9FIRM|nr:undecaprenyl-diphosphate phosphatase [Absicoccus porci]MCI6087269.1 undecaprenyl-diphosphate phosphatase [Absicoccus porci]MDD6460565.1 undecaprenyl-diphosphate phosphatase [Absicoccus porci]MDD7329779.1 undecaprenyl-diphosphate phosphatase [Absicoccus porci]MDY4738404.1 undecaprenyl-diphosphate phosphatase [Absicoccus porci]MEE1354717.1 undecaprenyl-diphosphate phosphatase [Absicoccus porci]